MKRLFPALVSVACGCIVRSGTDAAAVPVGRSSSADRYAACQPLFSEEEALSRLSSSQPPLERAHAAWWLGQHGTQKALSHLVNALLDKGASTHRSTGLVSRNSTGARIDWKAVAFDAVLLVREEARVSLERLTGFSCGSVIGPPGAGDWEQRWQELHKAWTVWLETHAATSEAGS